MTIPIRDEKLALAEALLFVSGDPVELPDIAEVLMVAAEEAQEIMQELARRHDADAACGTMVRQVDGGWQICTKSIYGQCLKERYAPPLALSNAALETLAIIAYRAPVTRTQIEQLRGVGSERSIATLLERDLIWECGRAQIPGRPILYDVTPVFRRKTNWDGSECAKSIDENEVDHEGTTAEVD